MTVALAVLGPVLALLGVLFGLWLGHRRWQAEQAAKEKADESRHTREAYLGLWAVVSETERQIRDARNPGMTSSQFAALMADVNNYLLAQGLWIQRKDRYLVLEYLFWTSQFITLVLSDSTARDYLLISAVYDGLPRKLNVASEALKRSDELRSQLRERIRTVIGAPGNDGWSDEVRPSEALLAQILALHAEIGAERIDAEAIVPLQLPAWPENLELPEIVLSDGDDYL